MSKLKRSIFAENIIRRRKALGWSQAELADISGYTRVIINRLEMGKSEGSIHSREVIAETLGCTIADLYTDPSKPRNELIGPLLTSEIVKPVLGRSEVLPFVQAAVLALICPDSYLEKLSLDRQVLLREFVKAMNKPR